MEDQYICWKDVERENGKLQSKTIRGTYKGSQPDVKHFTEYFRKEKMPMDEELYPYSGDYEVWNGLVPDLAMRFGRLEIYCFETEPLHIIFLLV